MGQGAAWDSLRPLSLPSVGLPLPVRIWSSGLFLSWLLGWLRGSSLFFRRARSICHQKPHVIIWLTLASPLSLGGGLQDHGDQNSRFDGEPGDRPRFVPKAPVAFVWVTYVWTGLELPTQAICLQLPKSEAEVLVTQSCNPLDCSQASLSMDFSRQEYWSGQPFPSLEYLPDPGIEPGSPALAGGSLPSKPPGELTVCTLCPLSLRTWAELVTESPPKSLKEVTAGEARPHTAGVNASRLFPAPLLSIRPSVHHLDSLLFLDSPSEMGKEGMPYE